MAPPNFGNLFSKLPPWDPVLCNTGPPGPPLAEDSLNSYKGALFVNFIKLVHQIAHSEGLCELSCKFLVTLRATEWLFIMTKFFIMVVIKLHFQGVSIHDFFHNLSSWMVFHYELVFQFSGYHVLLSKGLYSWISCHHASSWMGVNHDKVAGCFTLLIIKIHVQRVSFYEFLVAMEAAEWFFIRKQYNGRSCLYCDKIFMIKDPMKVQKNH